MASSLPGGQGGQGAAATLPPPATPGVGGMGGSTVSDGSDVGGADGGTGAFDTLAAVEGLVKEMDAAAAASPVGVALRQLFQPTTTVQPPAPPPPPVDLMQPLTRDVVLNSVRG